MYRNFTHIVKIARPKLSIPVPDAVIPEHFDTLKDRFEQRYGRPLRYEEDEAADDGLMYLDNLWQSPRRDQSVDEAQGAPPLQS